MKICFKKEREMNKIRKVLMKISINYFIVSNIKKEENNIWIKQMLMDGVY